jgi:hypothetical protein
MSKRQMISKISLEYSDTFRYKWRSDALCLSMKYCPNLRAKYLNYVGNLSHNGAVTLHIKNESVSSLIICLWKDRKNKNLIDKCYIFLGIDIYDWSSSHVYIFYIYFFYNISIGYLTLRLSTPLVRNVQP